MPKRFVIFSILLSLLATTAPVHAATLTDRVLGKILLQVESKGEAWYVDPTDRARHYLGRPDDAFRIMREKGLGISETDFAKLEKDTAFRRRLSGRILLRVHAKGEAYYVNPADTRMHFMGRPADAYNLMRTFGLGISNNDIKQIVDAKEIASPASLPARNDATVSYTKSPFGWNPPTSCKGDHITIDRFPIDPENLKFIIPLGQMSATGHVTPTDHGYLIQKSGRHPLYAGAAGFITNVGAMPTHKPGVKGDYRVILWHTCTLSTIFIHLDELSPRLLSIIGELKPGENWYPNWHNLDPIAIAKDEVIGFESDGGVDYSVHDTNVVLKGFVVPEHYTEQWKLHTANAFEYFSEPLKTQLEALSLRAAPPRFGKIDHDVDGRLIGNWFLEGTNGYQGTQIKDYWTTHLALAPHHLDPTLQMITWGGNGAGGKQYAIKRDSPKFADVSVTSGLVKFELAWWDLVIDDGSNRLWDNQTPPGAPLKGLTGATLGTALIQMLEDRKIKFEIFPDQKPEAVPTFTANAKIYTR